MPFRDVLGQGTACRLLQRALAGGRLSHAYLFVGPDGSGKALLARSLIMALRCAAPLDPPDACGVCAPCRRVADGSDADTHWLADEKGLRADGARDVLRAAALRPFGSGRPVFVLESAERMSPEAARTLLKTLEEPPGGAVFLLLSAHAGQMPDTVRSRCQVVALTPVARPALAAWLCARGCAPERAQAAAALSSGVPGRALALASDGGWEARRDAALAFVAGEERETVAAAIRRGAQAVEAMDLDLLGLVVRDLLCVALGADASVVLADAVPRLHAVAAGWTPSGLAAAAAAIQEASEAEAAHAARQLNWEVLAVRLRRLRTLPYNEEQSQVV